MGVYLNPGSEGFQRGLRSQIYVDKSLLIQRLNRLVRTEQRYVCVSRPRQFGKTMAVDMLAAYYGCEADTRALFEGLKISEDPSLDEHLNRYDLIRVNMQFLLETNLEFRLRQLNARIIDELVEANENICFRDKEDLAQVMLDIFIATGRSFVILIDEWDCPLREKNFSPFDKKRYLDHLRAWLKDQDYVALAYMTGLMPVSSYEVSSALNMFADYSMINSSDLAEFFGFTGSETEVLCKAHGMDCGEMQKWYGGYSFVSHGMDGDMHHSMLHPKSVVESLLRHKFDIYWTRAEECTALEEYLSHETIRMNACQVKNVLEIKNAIDQMLAGKNIEINVGICSNLQYQRNKDEWLTLLVLLGYLAFDIGSNTVSIPNREAVQMFSVINGNIEKSSLSPDEPVLLLDDPVFLMNDSIVSPDEPDIPF